MTLPSDAQALSSPFVRCRDGRIGSIYRIRANYDPNRRQRRALSACRCVANRPCAGFRCSACDRERMGCVRK